MASDPLKTAPTSIPAVSTTSKNDTATRARTPEEVRAEIARARQELATAATELRQQVAEKTDWRGWVRNHPGPVLAGAFVIGFWIGYRD